MDFWEAPVLVLPELPELPELYAALGTEGMGGMDFVFSDSFVFWQTRSTWSDWNFGSFCVFFDLYCGIILLYNVYTLYIYTIYIYNIHIMYKIYVYFIYVSICYILVWRLFTFSLKHFKELQVHHPVFHQGFGQACARSVGFLRVQQQCQRRPCPDASGHWHQYLSHPAHPCPPFFLQ